MKSIRPSRPVAPSTTLPVAQARDFDPRPDGRAEGHAEPMRQASPGKSDCFPFEPFEKAQNRNGRLL